MIYTFPVHHAYQRWFGQVPSFYYASDNYVEDYGFHPAHVATWECSLVRGVRRVFAVSEDLADILAARYDVSREKFVVVPNGLPQERIPQKLAETRPPAPNPVPKHFRPLVGVLGGINKRLRLDWVLQAVEALPSLHWAFVGPVGELDEATAGALTALTSHPRCCFTGAQDYERLFDFAESFDVAVVPLGPDGINSTCSPVRLFTQLPFGQPILATSGCRQLEEFAPAVDVLSSADQLIESLRRLEKAHFCDGLETRRRELAGENTWQKRAQTIFQHLSF
ncbi:MAG TPA: glycosyltransferase [Prosthecobacter sp.]